MDQSRVRVKLPKKDYWGPNIASKIQKSGCVGFDGDRSCPDMFEEIFFEPSIMTWREQEVEETRVSNNSKCLS